MPCEMCRNGSSRIRGAREGLRQIAEYQFSAAFLHFLLRCGGTLFIVSRVRGPGSGLHEGSNETNATGGERNKMAKPMSKSKIVGHLAEKCETPRRMVSTFFDELFKLAVKECKGGAGKFVIPNLGRAVKAHRKARMGRNPQTGEAIKIKAKTVVRLRPAKAFKDAVLGS
jgi:DNA-binding protein HU-beta